MAVGEQQECPRGVSAEAAVRRRRARERWGGWRKRRPRGGVRGAVESKKLKGCEEWQEEVRMGASEGEIGSAERGEGGSGEIEAEGEGGARDRAIGLRGGELRQQQDYRRVVAKGRVWVLDRGAAQEEDARGGWSKERQSDMSEPYCDPMAGDQQVTITPCIRVLDSNNFSQG
ncbi:hypothetical protein Tco_1411046 [Tanacetum coccineum]